MEFESEPATVVKWCDCGCDCCTAKLDDSSAWLRTVKRKLDERDAEDALFIPGLSDRDVARVDIGNECAALREMVNSQQQTIQDLSIELDEERNAASSAANEAMSMILRLQSEKAEVQMEARQFKRFSEERMAHDQQEIMALEDCLYKREQTIEALTYEVHAYKHRMLSFGLTESEADGDNGGLKRNDSENGFEFPAYNYPPLKCNLIEHHASDRDLDDETVDVVKYPFDESPRDLKDIEERINQLEGSPRHSPVYEKVIIGNSPRKSSSYGSKEDLVSDMKKVDSVSEFGDDMSDRIYTVDSIHNLASFNSDPKANRGAYDDFKDNDIGGSEVKKLYARLHALEADRESMKQALMSMRTDKAQLVLLKEIAQHLYKDMSPPSSMPVKKPSVFQKFSFIVLFKWLASFLLWRKSTRRNIHLVCLLVMRA
ncbi:myosin-binding protein 7-like isoform X2 [Rutidosis leptorrhynchoides]|uniref:myosin-binding protein 7-like isoform X2 n=1 Tax=Rutidosis leptorrhynchoides TaxID=125765 RepID=UPI003A98D92B